MDDAQFDTLTRLVGHDRTRRNLLGAAFAGAVGTAAITLGLPELAEARKRKKKGKGKKNRCKKSGDDCTSDKQCCTSKTDLICDVPQGAGNSDTVCCGGQSAKCGGVDDEGNALPPFCCVGEAGVREFVCSQNDETNPNVAGTCIPAPQEP